MGYKVTGIGFEGLDPVAIPMWRTNGASVEAVSMGIGKLQSACTLDTPAVAAFVRGEKVRPQLRIQITRDGIDDVGGQVTITGTDTNSNQPPLVANTALVFNEQNRSEAVKLSWPNDLPNSLGVHKVTLSWTIKPEKANELATGQTEVHFYIVNQAPVVVPGVREEDYRLEQIAQWSCELAHGKTDTVDIANAIFASLPKLPLKYHSPNNKSNYTLRQLIVDGYGMCGRWGKFFQALLAWQGIEAPRRFFSYLWSDADLSNDQSVWAAIVVKKFGQGNDQVPLNLSEEIYHDYAGAYPVDNNTEPVDSPPERRWRFWADRDDPNTGDGHQLVFLQRPNSGNVIVYDPSFSYTVEYKGGIPPENFNRQTGQHIADFKQQYLDRAVDYFMGGLIVKERSYLIVNKGEVGLTVLTQKIPDDKITLIWKQG